MFSTTAPGPSPKRWQWTTWASIPGPDSARARSVGLGTVFRWNRLVKQVAIIEWWQRCVLPARLVHRDRGRGGDVQRSDSTEHWNKRHLVEFLQYLFVYPVDLVSNHEADVATEINFPDRLRIGC